jgi:FMN phosphatase YigB (HAD superfamily)
MALRAVSLDLFDTLVDLDFDWRTAMQDSLRALHQAVEEIRPVPYDEFVDALRGVDREPRETRYAEGHEVSTGDRFAALCDRLELAPPTLPERLSNVHMGVLHSCVGFVDHHADVLGALGQRVAVALCSNFSHAPTAYRVLDEAGLRGHLDAIAISVEVGIRKPRREIFEAVLGDLGVSPEQTLHVGDNLDADVTGAAALGMRTAWITRRVADPDEALLRHTGPRPDFVIRDLRELLPLVDTPAE